MGTTAYLLEITPPHREHDPLSTLSIAVALVPQLFMFGVFALLAISFPFARFVLAACVLWYAVVAVMLIRTLRRGRRGVAQTPTLWLTSDSIGFADGRGVTRSTPRTAVTSALRIFATVNGQTHDLLVFRDARDNAVLSTPLSAWRPEDVDRVTQALGIQAAPRRFVNSADELEAAAHGVPQPTPLAVPRSYRWMVLGTYVVVVVVVVVVLVTQR